jgi:hypothetical protein
MPLDFTIEILNELYQSMIAAGYNFNTYLDFSTGEVPGKCVILRHDVDARKNNSLQFAQIQSALDIKATYYFRTVPGSYDEKLMKQVEGLGHEVGYHYETMDTSRGSVDKAYTEFCRNLEKFRRVLPVRTICMHGSPLSRFDNREIWKKYDYRSLGIIAEPYFDLDFNKTFYLTDTGRRWDGHKVSVRDKMMDSQTLINQDFLTRTYRSTNDIIRDLRADTFPKQVMMTFHPQRWTDNKVLWLQEKILQNLKNLLKRLMING